MPRHLALALVAASVVAGCANPAEDKFKVTASEPKPVPDSPSPEPAKLASIDKPAPPLLKSDAAPEPTAPVALVIAPATSKLEFVASKVTGSHVGGFRTVSGTAELTPDQSALARIAVDIDMASTYSDNDSLTGHLKAPDFFDVAKYPKAVFVTTEIKPGGEKGANHTVTGNLTLHGVTKSITFPAAITVKEGAAALAAEFALNRRDFGINYPGKVNDLIRDEVVIKLDVKAPKKA